MARDGAKRNTRKLKIGRRLGVNLWGQAKSPFNKRKYKPGQHGPTSRGGNMTDYAKQMRAKQTLKGYYGNIGDRFSAINSEFNLLYKKSILRKSGTNSGMLGIVKPMEEQNERQYL